MRPPFQDQFDRCHWWEEKRFDLEIGPVAALYELARRHPRIGQVQAEMIHAICHGQELHSPFVGAASERMARQAIHFLKRESKAIRCLCLIGLHSWPELDTIFQNYWVMSAGNMKGLDCRYDMVRCHSVTGRAEHVIHLARLGSLKLDPAPLEFQAALGRKNVHVRPLHPQAYKKALELLKQDLRRHPISSSEMEAAIAREAVNSHQRGHLVLSMARDLKSDEARILFERMYRAHRQRTSAVRQRAKCRDWLPLIAACENGETFGGMKPPAFHQYRRAVDNIHFTEDPPRV